MAAVSGKPAGDGGVPGSKAAAEPVQDATKPLPVNETIQKFLQDQALPLVFKFSNIVVAKGIPMLDLAYQKLVVVYEMGGLEKLKPLLPALIGILMCFFGGSYLTLIATIEAYRMTGWAASSAAVATLYKNAVVAWDASKKDDEVDADGNGVADVKEIGHKALLQRKTMVVLASVNPEEVTNAFVAINTGFMAVVATLKISFARSITLGVSIAEVVTPMAVRLIGPALAAALPPQHSKWAVPVIVYACKSISVSMAWFLQRIISAFHSAIRGGSLASEPLLEAAAKHGGIKSEQVKGLVEPVGMALAFLGFMFQLKYGFGLPFPLNLLLLPFTIIPSVLEYILGVVVAML